MKLDARLIAYLALVAALALAMAHATGAQPEAICGTDSECMKLCPPADADCDGGPQP